MCQHVNDKFLSATVDGNTRRTLELRFQLVEKFPVLVIFEYLGIAGVGNIDIPLPVDSHTRRSNKGFVTSMGKIGNRSLLKIVAVDNTSGNIGYIYDGITVTGHTIGRYKLYFRLFLTGDKLHKARKIPFSRQHIVRPLQVTQIHDAGWVGRRWPHGINRGISPGKGFTGGTGRQEKTTTPYYQFRQQIPTLHACTMLTTQRT